MRKKNILISGALSHDAQNIIALAGEDFNFIGLSYKQNKGFELPKGELAAINQCRIRLRQIDLNSFHDTQTELEKISKLYPNLYAVFAFPSPYQTLNYQSLKTTFDNDHIYIDPTDLFIALHQGPLSILNLTKAYLSAYPPQNIRRLHLFSPSPNNTFTSIVNANFTNTINEYLKPNISHLISQHHLIPHDEEEKTKFINEFFKII